MTEDSKKRTPISEIEDNVPESVRDKQLRDATEKTEKTLQKTLEMPSSVSSAAKAAAARASMVPNSQDTDRLIRIESKVDKILAMLSER